MPAGAAEAYSSLSVFLVGQVGQVGPALTKPIVLASDLSAYTRTGRT
jgi:hypothetical protein